MSSVSEHGAQAHLPSHRTQNESTAEQMPFDGLPLEEYRPSDDDLEQLQRRMSSLDMQPLSFPEYNRLETLHEHGGACGRVERQHPPSALSTSTAPQSSTQLPSRNAAPTSGVYLARHEPALSSQQRNQKYSEDTRPRSHNQNALGGAPIATSKTPKKDGTWKDFNTRLKTVSSDGRSRQSRPASFLDYKHSPQQSESRKKSTDTAAGRTGNLTQPKARNARLDRSITLRPPSPTVPQLPVPTPSTPYIDDARAAPRPLANPQRLLIVIDLNGTVLFRPTRTRPTYFITRPEVKRFFEYLFANHAVMVWSSARPENVELMCDKLFDSEQRKRLVAVWGRDTLGLSPAQYHAKVQVYKRLNQIWREPKLGQEQGVEWNQSNTLLIDDSLEKAKGEPYNAIQVPEFLGLVPKKRERENVLQQVVGFLEEARHWDNISSFVRERGFEADGRWNWPWPVDEDDLP